MANIPKAIFCWSGGKDSSYCLHKVLSGQLFDVQYLLTTVNATYGRVSMHGVREELLEAQATSIGIPLLKVKVSEGTNSEYEQQMEAVLLRAKAEGIEHVIFGDIFLEDLSIYRENNLEKVGMTGVFPIWKIDTRFLIEDFLAKEFRTIICCTNDGYLGQAWCGREIDSTFLQDLPAHVDPCGENGEFHTFCFSGPVFKQAIPFTLGENTYRPLEIKTNDDSISPNQAITKGFWFRDLLPE
jgi:uncharacterized protein (TIGR00290 family)